MKVIAYICQYNGKGALSTDAQLEQIQIYASRHHLDLIEIIKDTQHVADLRKNSGLKRAFNKCQENPEIPWGSGNAPPDPLLNRFAKDSSWQFDRGNMI